MSKMVIPDCSVRIEGTRKGVQRCLNSHNAGVSKESGRKNFRNYLTVT